LLTGSGRDDGASLARINIAPIMLFISSCTNHE